MSRICAIFIALFSFIFSGYGFTPNATDSSEFEFVTYDGDMLIPIDLLSDNETDHRIRQKRAVAKSPNLWPGNEVPYILDGRFSDFQKKRVMEAFNVLHSLTCVRFRPKKPSDKAYVNIEHAFYSKSCGYDDSACKAAVGYYGPRLHPVCLGNPCFGCKFHTVIIHELMHVLGFVHEHARVDRNTKGTVSSSHARSVPRRHVNRNFCSNDSIPYDTRSIMHYHSDYFAIERDKGSINVKPEFQHVMSMKPNCNKTLTTTDIYAINNAYKCDSEASCHDANPNLCVWAAAQGDCNSDVKDVREWHRVYCARSCGMCPHQAENSLICKDLYEDEKYCQVWKQTFECVRYPFFLNRYCKLSCGKCKDVNAKI